METAKWIIGSLIAVCLVWFAIYHGIRQNKQQAERMKYICLYSFKMGVLHGKNKMFTDEGFRLQQSMEKRGVGGYITFTLIDNVDVDNNGNLIIKGEK